MVNFDMMKENKGIAIERGGKKKKKEEKAGTKAIRNNRGTKIMEKTKITKGGNKTTRKRMLKEEYGEEISIKA